MQEARQIIKVRNEPAKKEKMAKLDIDINFEEVLCKLRLWFILQSDHIYHNFCNLLNTHSSVSLDLSRDFH